MQIWKSRLATLCQHKVLQLLVQGILRELHGEKAIRLVLWQSEPSPAQHGPAQPTDGAHRSGLIIHENCGMKAGCTPSCPWPVGPLDAWRCTAAALADAADWAACWMTGACSRLDLGGKAKIWGASVW